jgi:hypothetical protein
VLLEALFAVTVTVNGSPAVLVPPAGSTSKWSTAETTTAVAALVDVHERHTAVTV